MALRFLNDGVFSGDVAGTILTSQKASIPPSNGSFIGRLNFKAYRVGTTYSTGASITAVASSAWTGTSTGTHLQFSTTSDAQVNPVNKMYLTSGGDLGVGVQFPGSRISVSGFTGAYSSGIGFEPVGTGARIYRTFINTDGSFNLDDATAGETRLKIDSAGNVGINDTSPDFKLDIGGTLGVSDLPFNITSVSVLVANETIGAEEVTNGDFATDTAWTKETGWSIGSGVASYNGSATDNALYENLSLTTGATYKLVFTIVNYVSGILVGALSGGSLTGNTPDITANGTYAFDLTATGVLCIFRSTSSFNGSIDNVSLKRVISSSDQIQKRELSSDAFGPGNGPYLPLAGGTLTGDLTIAKTDPTITLFDSSGTNTDPNGKIIFSEAAGSTNFEIVYNGANDRLEFNGLISGTLTDLVYINRSTATTLLCLGGITSNKIMTANGFRTSAGNVDYSYISRNSTGNTLFVQAVQDYTNQPIAKFSYGSATVNAGTTILQVSKNNSHFLNCNLGVGTISPDALLHVESTSATGANFILESTHSGGIPLLDLKGAASAQLRYKDELNVIQGRIDFGDSGTFNFIDVPNNESTLYLKTGGDVGIGTTTPAEKLDVNGRVRIGDVNYAYGGSNYHILLAEDSNDAYISNINGYGVLSAGGYYYGGNLRKLNSTSTAYSGIQTRPDGAIIFESATGGTAGDTISATEKMRISSNGSIQFAAYNSSNNIGTATYLLGTDVSGNVVKTSAAPSANFNQGAKTHAVGTAFSNVLTVALSSHQGCYVTLCCFGDWGGHSSAAYRGEFFLQNGAGVYNEPGIIIRQDDNTSDGTDQIICQILDPGGSTGSRNFIIQIRHTDTTSPATFTGTITFTVQGQFNSVT